ncbi:ornithine cyclodeaminase family protein [Schizosaccharomyces japonicus yFS275]|uniref:Ornithine cyclodeaminase family protein n=1 Tax=Schizosaccharomyces japonicus (strain yFS275 / FY16936) TaxID=402676 RepID=B6K7K5_SCHJY|nr:ornithine cyclodeaminase family protein [Schizosaccharomyces japonicus yFS275]EEB09509.1 ornithine cyclodeaminase family protein [Schizosaccharomyces japonicus yFS275]
MSQYVSAEKLSSLLKWPKLIQAIKDIFCATIECPPRLHYSIANASDSTAPPAGTMLIMPAWIPGKFIGVKQVNVFPGNSQLGLPGLSSQYLLSDGLTGMHLVQLDGNELTGRRTAAASALAASFLAREDASSLLILGAGKIAEKLVHAYLAIRPIRRIRIWNHRLASGERLTLKLQEQLKDRELDIACVPEESLAQAVGEADIVSAATLSNKPLIQGNWLTEGTHVDLVGAFTPAMRETDTDCIRLAEVFVDTRTGALSEPGDLLTPMKEGVFSANDVHADLFDLCRGTHRGRSQLENADQAITLFKSVGDSREDLAAAILAYNSLQNTAE